MTVADLILLLISLFGMLTFGSLSVLWLKDRAAGRITTSLVTGLLVIYTTGWFVVNTALAFQALYSDYVRDLLHIVMWTMTYLYPPLIMHIHYSEHCRAPVSAGSTEAGRRVLPKQPWLGIIIVTYIVSSSLGAIPSLFFMGLLDSSWLGSVGFVIMALFFSAALFSIVVTRKTTQLTGETSEERITRRWHLLFWVLVFAVFPILFLAGPGGFQEVLAVLTRGLPLLFVFVSMYYLERFQFFDVFVKRGFFVLLVMLFLAGYFRVVASYPNWVGVRAVEPWLYALTLLPVAALLPWFYRLLESWLDRAWLGREFTPVEAVKYFLSGVRNATSEQDLIRQAEERLGKIFQADTLVLTSSDPVSKDFDSRLNIPLRLSGVVGGSIRMGHRANNMPFFSKDMALLISLADVLTYLLENVRLQERKQEHEKRQKELEIHASQSELKALRAQINPHFLFNALNAIAGLIHQDPNQAEETVEQLAEIFRYALQSSEKEWAKLEDEIEFVRAYLQVEQSRFGDRLQVSVELEDSVRDVRFPVMMIQTLVENAVKHGVASVRGKGQIRVRAGRSSSGVWVEVADNGPGPEETRLRPQGRGKGPVGSGYGLKNVRDRLQGYFGEKAKLTLSRDASEGLTVAAIQMPDPVAVTQERRSS